MPNAKKDDRVEGKEKSPGEREAGRAKERRGIASKWDQVSHSRHLALLNPDQPIPHKRSPGPKGNRKAGAEGPLTGDSLEQPALFSA